MSSVDKEQLIRVREFLTEHPDAARKFFEENPDALRQLTGDTTGKVQESGGNSLAGKRLSKSLPWFKETNKENGSSVVFDWYNNNGFSNYLMLAALAFSIQLLITLICIFFYK